MQYEQKITLRNGAECCLRSGTAADSRAVLEHFILTHGQTEFLASYPDEKRFTVEQEAAFLEGKAAAPREIELLAIVDGMVAGMAGIDARGNREKLQHRAEFGISVDKAFWSLGIGRALTEACIACARQTGYRQLELEVVADNQRAVALYTHLGFQEYGRNPKGFLTRSGRWQHLILMRLELN